MGGLEFTVDNEDENYRYIIDGWEGELMFVGGNPKKDGIQLAFWWVDFARENAHKYSMVAFIILQKGTIANILEAYEDWDYEEKREIQKELIELLESPGSHLPN